MSALPKLDDISMPDSTIEGPSAWYGPDMDANTEWLRPFSDTELAELDDAMRAAKARGDGVIDITRGNFNLPTLGPVLNVTREELLEGRGFVLLRGIPVERYSIEESAMIYYGIGAHLGYGVPQNGKGHVLGHVKDLGYDHEDTNVRIYQTAVRQTFHTDGCDFVSLLCLKPAKCGGLSSIVSSVTMFNEMYKRRPDLAAVLFRPLAVDRRGEVPEGYKGYFDMPPFNWFVAHQAAPSCRRKGSRKPDTDYTTWCHHRWPVVRVPPRLRSQAGVPDMGNPSANTRSASLTYHDCEPARFRDIPPDR